MNVNVANTSAFNTVRIRLVNTSVTATLGLYVLPMAWAVKVSIYTHIYRCSIVYSYNSSNVQCVVL